MPQELNTVRPVSRERERGLSLRFVARALAVLLAAGSLVASEPQRPWQPIVGNRIWLSPHFVYESRRDDDSVCPGILASLENDITAVTGFLGIAATRVRYVKFRDRDDLRNGAHCQPGSAACFFSGIGIETHAPFERHELIHAYLAPLGDSHKLLEEGAAEAFSCGKALRSRTRIPWSDAFSTRFWANADMNTRHNLYAAGSWFVAHLLRTFPASRFVAFYRALPPTAEADAAASAFERIYRLALPDVWTRALSNPDPSAGCIYAAECAAPDLARHPLTSWDRACDHGDRVRSLRVDGTRWLTEQTNPMSARIAACDAHVTLPQQERLGQASLTALGSGFGSLLAPGRYFVIPTQTDTQLALTDARTLIARVDQCERTRAIETPGELDVLWAWSGRSLARLLPPASGGGRAWVMRWEARALESRGLEVVACSANLRVSACTRCAVEQPRQSAAAGQAAPDCSHICDGNVRGAGVSLAPSPLWLRFATRDGEDAWFAVRRVPN